MITTTTVRYPIDCLPIEAASKIIEIWVEDVPYEKVDESIRYKIWEQVQHAVVSTVRHKLYGGS